MVATVPLLTPNHIYWMVELGGALVHTIDWIWSTHIWFLFLSILISTIYGYDTSTNSQPYLLDMVGPGGALVHTINWIWSTHQASKPSTNPDTDLLKPLKHCLK